MKVVPMSIQTAKGFVGALHRHNRPPVSGLFAAAVEDAGDIVGVVICGRPVARALDDGQTLEITRVATNGARNANSMLYGAALRAARALGYRRVYTYTLAEESGASLRAVGFTQDAELAARATWSCPSRPRMQQDLFGEERRPPGAKVRWVVEFNG